MVSPSAQASSQDISVSPAAAPQNSPNITQKGPDPQPISQATGAPDLAPGEKPDPKKQPSIYGEIPQIPVLDAVEGIKFDFNHGIRILFPQNGKNYHVTFTDIDTGIILYSADTVPGAFITSVKKFFIRFRLIIHDKGNDTPIFTHDYDATDKEVMIQLPVGTIGDSIGWFSYVERFQQKHKCKLICVMTPWIADIFKKQYPSIKFITTEETKTYRPYASYYMGLFFRGDVDNQPIDFRYIGLHRTAGYILGLEDTSDIPPRVDLSAPRKIKEKYVCIAAQSSSQAKYWNNPFGWITLVQFLKDNGYRVLCIDKEKVHGIGLNWNYIPYGTEDFTGDIPLQERINLIKDADFFVGLSSGLSWLAWTCKVPVVMISGFTHPTNEFATPYRIINYHTCHSCWNDMRENFDHYDFLWCPRHKGTDRHFECTRLISAEQVINTIKKIPTFRPGEKKDEDKKGDDKNAASNATARDTGAKEGKHKK
ncbi:MAG: autotransporter strand-loop-strand O-heptosyltransferase [Lentisphaeria bacterium]|nr:autotransporter strand-loop-strand O-heptosyltransferase [Lentisphaeria bacterium]